MADYPASQSVSTAPVSAGVLAYALFAISAILSMASSGLHFIAPLTGIVGIVGVIVCYVKRAEAQGTWVASHFTWLIRTFWWSLLWAVAGWVALILLAIVLIGFLIGPAIWLAAGIWVIYRVIRGYLLFKESKPIPGY
jgi:uncharacterized membrane protein